ncbi:ABC transporter ATP-binding protein [Nocardioides zeae]|uniref:ABC transporter ATP-binding protein n=1 Tax=Nocardioides imazamoxiresistens TaxID=3231893 RepID=A0ABU3Q1V8_9ACTN|nr:ABC transporter ATP-binding protein [Nocardioides zeae]MDT9595017.1 ABC transporter ATP-binding protein [Nocardioides zeae]
MSLEIRDLSVAYGRRTILDGVDLVVERGRLLGLLGPNGSGKSTLIKTVARIVKPRSGTLEWDGLPLDRLSRRDLARVVAYVPQAIDQSFSLSVREAVVLGRTPHFGARPRRRDWAKVDLALEQLGLVELADRPVSELSGGQAQRVLVARALAQEPQVLLLDEPTSALDLRYQLQTLHLAHTIAAEQGVATVVSIHDLNHAARFCDEVAFLSGGRVLAAGEPGEVYGADLVRDVYGVGVDLSVYDGFTEVHPQVKPDRTTRAVVPQAAPQTAPQVAPELAKVAS